MAGNMSTKLEAEVTDVFTFIFGGRAEFTIENVDSGNGFKYKVTQCRDNKKLFFVKVKEGSDWNYAGYMTLEGENQVSYKRGQKGAKDFDDPAIKGLSYAVRKGHKSLPRPMIMMHHGKCACCGRKLDDEASVARGIGPVCWDRLTSEAKEKMSDKAKEAQAKDVEVQMESGAKNIEEANENVQLRIATVSYKDMPFE